MPLDGHAHLVSQGWSGKGSGLRSGAITKPINIVQKKTLAGVGKDRDEAFPFWDHVFQAASVSIQVKVHNSDDESDSEGCSTPNLTLERTKTGIISNRRPTTGTPALSGATTPSEPLSMNGDGDGALSPRLSIMAQAKQQSARRMLYAMFYRGPVLSTDDDEKAKPVSASLSGSFSSSSPAPVEKKSKEGKGQKRKAAAVGDEDKAERKRRKREAKDAEKRLESKGKEKATDDDEEGDRDCEDVDDSKAAKAARKADKAERKRLKAEKRARKGERRKKRAARKAKEEAQAASSDDDEPARTGEATSQETILEAEAAVSPVKRDSQNMSKRARDSSDDTSSKQKRAKKKTRKS